MIKFYISLALSAACLGACASRDDGAAQTEAARRLAAPDAALAVPVVGLPAQTLAPGECGVFLWGLSTPRRFVFFAETTSGEALVLSGEEAVSLQQTGAKGDVIGSFLTESDYRAADGSLSASLEIVPGEPIEDGQRIASGRLVSKGPDGWETVLPVAGLYACIPG